MVCTTLVVAGRVHGLVAALAEHQAALRAVGEGPALVAELATAEAQVLQHVLHVRGHLHGEAAVWRLERLPTAEGEHRGNAWGRRRE